MTSTSRYVAFLRGINVGGHKRIAMADLRAALERAGHTDVATYLQSGNAVFSAPESGPARGRTDRLARGVEVAIESALGLEVDVVVRSRAELAAVVRHDPLGVVATDPSRYHVMFLASKPDAAARAAIDPARFEPERFAVRGREFYVWMPAGVRNAPLFAALGKIGPRGQIVTARNWNTVTQVLDLLDQ